MYNASLKVRVLLSHHRHCLAISMIGMWCTYHDVLSQEGRRKEAAKACATFLYYNRHDVDATISMGYYKRNENITEEDLTPFHTLPYVWDTYTISRYTSR